MTDDTATDEALMHAYVAGNAASFELIYNRYERRLFGFFLRAIGNRARAEDLLQQTFLNVHRARKRYRGGGFAAWIHAIAYNLYRQECRRLSRRPESPLTEEPLTAASDPGAQLDAENRLGQVWRSLDQLSAPQREALVLCRFLELDYAEAAKLLGCTEDAAKLRVFRGLRALRAVLESTDGEKARLSEKSDSSA